MGAFGCSAGSVAVESHVFGHGFSYYICYDTAFYVLCMCWTLINYSRRAFMAAEELVKTCPVL